MKMGGPSQFLLDVDIRVIDQRIGQGVGGFDTVVRAYHKPTGLLVEVPKLGRGTQSRQREIALEMIEWALARAEE
jgi:protein subunit release factor A